MAFLGCQGAGVRMGVDFSIAGAPQADFSSTFSNINNRFSTGSRQ